MAKRKDKLVMLQCTKCGEENYITSKNKKIHLEKLELKKHCKKCKKHTPHKETKKKNW